MITADETTENGTEEYLFGTVEGGSPGYVYWSGVSGSRKVILRKVDGDFNSVGGKSFTIYRGSSSTPYPLLGAAEEPSELTSGDSGCLYVGVLPNGWYIIEEDISPKAYFYLIVDDSGVYGTLVEGDNGKDADKVGGYGTRAEAETEASARYVTLRAAAKAKAVEQNG